MAAVTWDQIEMQKQRFPGQITFWVSAGDYNALLAAVPANAAIVSDSGGKKRTTYVRQPYVPRTIAIEPSPMVASGSIFMP